MQESEIQRDPVEQVVAEFTDRLRAGEQISVDQYAAEHPELTSDIREYLATIVALEKTKVRKHRSGNGHATLAGAKLEKLDDFKIIREIGRGGMGIVYEAEEASLGRRVALKVLPKQSLLEERHLQRFQREAKTAAKLHHTNIVPVFGIGEQDGYHYYVMQLIPGFGLDRILNQLRKDNADQISGFGDPAIQSGDITRITTSLQSLEDTKPSTTSSAPDLSPLDAKFSDALEANTATYWPSVARIGIQAADALSYAHQQNLLHRDVKPANLLLDDHGNIWVADFGLAKALEHDDVSRTGEIVGTLRYIAPEQFNGKADARSDIYCLGLTLYELLTLRPAFDDNDRNQLMRQITAGNVIRPRKLNPQIPHDLETIVLKAIACEPAHRYQTASAFADDLRRFRDDIPILARRISPAERLWRWSRRNPALASVSALAVALLVLVAVITSAGYIRESRQRERAETNLATSLEALDKIYNRFAPDRIVATSNLTLSSGDEEEIAVLTQPVLSKETAALLEEILPFYDRFAEEDSDNELLRAEAAKANRRVGDIHQRLGQYEEAESAYQRAIERYERLAADAKDSQTYQMEIARIRNERGNVYRLTQEMEKSRVSHLAALQILQFAEQNQAALPESRYELARTYYFLGKRDTANAVGPPPASPHPGSHPNRPPRQGPSSHQHGPPRYANRPGPPPHLNQNGPPQHVGHNGPPHPPRNGNGELGKAISLLAELNEHQPEIAEYRYLMALCYREQSHFFLSDSMSRAIEILEKLSGDFPAVADYRFELSETYSAIDVRRTRDDERPIALERLRAAVKWADALAIEHPNMPDYAHSRAQSHHKLSLVLRIGRHIPGDGRLLEAVKHDQEAVQIQSSLVEQFPTAWPYRVWMARMQHSLANTLRDTGQLDQAQVILEESINNLDETLALDSSLWFVHHMLFEHNRMLAEIFDNQGKSQLAIVKRKEAKRHHEQIPSGPNNRNRGPFIAPPPFHHGMRPGVRLPNPSPRRPENRL